MKLGGSGRQPAEHQIESATRRGSLERPFLPDSRRIRAVSKIFISYRREDSGPISRRLADSLTRHFGMNAVFIDTDSIRLAQNWKQQIDNALYESSVVVVVIGSRWLFIQDAYGRRRIDAEDDWVRSEILAGIKNERTVLPVLVSGTTLPSAQALPDCMRPLLNSQGYELNDKYWDRDVSYLSKRLEEIGIQRASPDSSRTAVPYPVPIDTSKELTETELKDALISLPGWEITHRIVPADSDHQTVELYKAFKFKSFEDAIHFMGTAARFASITQHHPDWQNLWVSVRVWLTTWDIGHRLTFKDVIDLCINNAMEV
jgi:pterin-4a-carbinolamine dehydratase